MKPPLHETTRSTLKALTQGEALSRNKNFELFRDPHAAAARRLHRYLEHLASDLKAHLENARLSRGEGEGFALKIEYPLIHGKRTAYLSAFEVDLLFELHPWIAERVEA